MTNIIINILYWFVSTCQLLLMKIISHYYKIDNIVFNSVFRAFLLPYYIFKLFEYYKKNNKLYAQWCDISNGILDQIDIIISYIAFAGLTLGEYITYRTFSVFINGIYSIMYYKKIFNMEKIIGMFLILIACIILLCFYNTNNLFYSFMCIISSIAYSLISFIIEINIKEDEEKNLNFYWTKTISYLIAIFIGIICEFNYNTIYKIFVNFNYDKILFIIFIELLISLCENFYYYYKIKIISNYPKNGSLITQFIDIIRRFTLIIFSLIVFLEHYNSLLYICLSIMFIGSIIGLSDFTKFKKKEKNININLPDIEIISINE